MKKKSLFLLRLAIGFVFLYAGVSGFISPESWVGYLPQWVSFESVSRENILIIWNVAEILLGTWILFAKKIFIPSTIAAILLLGVTVTNFNQFEILFRDLSLALSALALALSSR